MMISQDVYQISGWINGSNSNNYVVRTDAGLVLVDTGCAEKQLSAMRRGLAFWGFSEQEIRDVFITHAHFDHSGNARYFQCAGARILAGAADAEQMAAAGPSTLEKLFGLPYARCTPDGTLEDGDAFTYGETTFEVIATPGHSNGSIALLANVKGRRILFTGDLFMIPTATPDDEIEVALGWDGDPNFDAKRYVDSLRRLSTRRIDVLATGHSACYAGDCGAMLARLLRMAEEKYGAFTPS